MDSSITKWNTLVMKVKSRSMLYLDLLLSSLTEYVGVLTSGRSPVDRIAMGLEWAKEEAKFESFGETIATRER